MPHSKYEENIKNFIDNYWKENFRPPTIRDIARGCGISSTSATDVLKNLGYTGDGKARFIIPEWVKRAIENYHKEEK